MYICLPLVYHYKLLALRNFLIDATTLLFNTTTELCCASAVPLLAVPMRLYGAYTVPMWCLCAYAVLLCLTTVLLLITTIPYILMLKKAVINPMC